MRAWVLFFALLLALVSSAAAQTMFRDIGLGDSCRTVEGKLERYDDYRPAEGDRCVSAGRGSYAIGGWFDYLFGQRDVGVNIWFDRPGDRIQRIVFLVNGNAGIDFIDAAIEGFTAQKGEPEFLRRIDAYEMVSQGSERTEVVARWPGEDGIIITVEAYAHPLFRSFSGRVRVVFEKPVTPTTPAQDAGQF